jgi:hypothetical protein
MNPIKQHAKLYKLNVKAQECMSREDAQKILKKANKVQHKLQYRKDGTPRQRELDQDQGSTGGSRQN